MNVRDKLWLFASRAHDDDIYLGPSNGFTRWSRITPAEGAMMLDVPNVIMIGSDGVPAPYSAEAYGYMESFYRMQNVVWSITGSGGFRAGNEENFICHLAERYPNVTGAFADDFLGAGQKTTMNEEEKRALILSARETLNTACRPLSMWLTVYTRDIESCDPSLYGLFDNLTLWTWEYRELERLSQNFERFEQKFPTNKKYLGIYILDYPSGKAIPNEYMELQCEYGLKLLREGQIDGMIFLTNCVMGIGLPSEYWLRDWIDRVKNIELP
ncbi:MAG: hypothetical protein IJX80_08420 [Clostridia bacterium]|nr:hypothetical protein [Clostridia bacterium]